MGRHIIRKLYLSVWLVTRMVRNMECVLWNHIHCVVSYWLLLWQVHSLADFHISNHSSRGDNKLKGTRQKVSSNRHLLKGLTNDCNDKVLNDCTIHTVCSDVNKVLNYCTIHTVCSDVNNVFNYCTIYTVCSGVNNVFNNCTIHTVCSDVNKVFNYCTIHTVCSGVNNVFNYCTIHTVCSGVNKVFNYCTLHTVCSGVNNVFN